MTQEIKDLPHSVHDRLLNIAKENRQTFEQVFYLYALERFLYRISISEFESNFILKGALMFFGWNLPLRRLTKDIDFQGYTSNDVDNIVLIMRQVCIQPVEPDGMYYDPESVIGEIIQEEADYEGVRINFIGFLGKAKLNLQVDVSFSDEITPAITEFSYPTLLPKLGMDPFKLRGYPFETSIAEKFETMVDKGEINSRMKDFYDIWVMIQRFEVQGTTLVKAINKTFQSRKTSIPVEIPEALTTKFAKSKSPNWAIFYKKLPLPPIVPSDFQLVIDDLHAFLHPPMLAASNGEEFKVIWYPDKGWT